MPYDTADSSGPGGDLSLELLHAIQRGDRDAWSKLYARYRDALLFSIRCRLGSKLRARLQSEDVLQSVVKDALTDLARFEHRGAGSLQHYLHVCVLNKIRSKAEYFDAERRAREEPLTDAAAAELAVPEPDALAYLDGDRYLRLERGLAVLPENLREVLLLRAVEGLSNQDAARVLGKSDEATSKLYGRALARLSSGIGSDADA